MKNPKLAIVGSGNIGKAHLRAFKSLGVDFVAAADIRQEALDEVKAEFGLDQLYLDYKKLLKEVRPDGVLVSTPNYLHGKVACDAMRAGANCLVEKPMTATLAQARQILETEKKTKKWVMMAFVCRFKAETVLATQMHDAGKFGEVYHSEIAYIRRRGIPKIGSWFTTKRESGGGVLIDLGVHMLDQSLSILGCPAVDEVFAGVYNKFGCDPKKYVYLSMWGGGPESGAVSDVEDFAAGTLRFKNGSTMNFQFSWAANSNQQGMWIQLLGDKGGARMGVGVDGLEIYAEDMKHLVDEKPYLPKLNPYEAEDREFVDCLVKNKRPRVNAKQGYYIQSIIDAVYRSGKQGKAVKVKQS